MANVNRPNGFSPIGTISGVCWEGMIRSYECDSSAGNIFPGDLIQMDSDGKISAATAGSVELIGACVGVKGWYPTKVGGTTSNTITNGATPDLSIKYHPTGTAAVILVAVGPDLLYEAQEDGVGGALALADIGANVDMVAGTGNALTGKSAQQIDSSTMATTSAQLRLVDFVDRVDNAIGAYARWIVRINENHFTKLAGI